MSLGMAVEGKRPAAYLTQLRSNARKCVETKCDRKQPRPGDVIPAPDSDAAKTGKGPQETQPTGQPEQTSTQPS